jgi:hypothetical protein
MRRESRRQMTRRRSLQDLTAVESQKMDQKKSGVCRQELARVQLYMQGHADFRCP